MAKAMIVVAAAVVLSLVGQALAQGTQGLLGNVTCDPVGDCEQVPNPCGGQSIALKLEPGDVATARFQGDTVIVSATAVVAASFVVVIDDQLVDPISETDGSCDSTYTFSAKGPATTHTIQIVHTVSGASDLVFNVYLTGLIATNSAVSASVGAGAPVPESTFTTVSRSSVSGATTQPIETGLSPQGGAEPANSSPSPSSGVTLASAHRSVHAVAIAVPVVIGVLLLVAGGVAIFLWRRRASSRRIAPSTAARNEIVASSWGGSQPAPAAWAPVPTTPPTEAYGEGSAAPLPGYGDARGPALLSGAQATDSKRILQWARRGA